MVMLDSTAFPHILDRVVAAAELPSLIRLRATCRTLRERVDRGIFDHVVLEWDEAGNKLVVTSPCTEGALLPIHISSGSLVNRFWRLGQMLGAPPDPTVKGAYDLKVHLPSLDALAHTRTIDVLDHSFPVDGFPDFSIPPLPPLPSLVRTRACTPILAPHCAMYLNIRAPPGQSRLGGTSERNAVTATQPYGCDLTIHVFFDSTWSRPLRGGLLWVAPKTVKSLTLVLHPARAPGQPIAPCDGLHNLVAGLSLSSNGAPRRLDFPLKIVGLETVPAELLGLPPTLSSAEVEHDVRGRPLFSSLECDFVSLAQWAQTTDALDVDVPTYMIKEVARTAMWSPVAISRDLFDEGQ